MHVTEHTFLEKIMLFSKTAPWTWTIDDNAIIQCCPHLMEVVGLISWKLHALFPCPCQFPCQLSIHIV